MKRQDFDRLEAEDAEMEMEEESKKKSKEIRLLHEQLMEEKEGRRRDEKNSLELIAYTAITLGACYLLFSLMGLA